MVPEICDFVGPILGILVTKGRMQTAEGLTQRCRRYIEGASAVITSRSHCRIPRRNPTRLRQVAGDRSPARAVRSSMSRASCRPREPTVLRARAIGTNYRRMVSRTAHELGGCPSPWAGVAMEVVIGGRAGTVVAEMMCSSVSRCWSALAVATGAMQGPSRRSAQAPRLQWRG
jgi:hypothetical protein